MALTFEPVLILPGQLLGGNTQRAEPERRLMLAVLEDAIAILERYGGTTDPRRIRHVREVEQWIAPTANDALFGFEHICAILNLDADVLRRGLRRLAASGSGFGRKDRRIARGVAGERHRIVVGRAGIR
jgi:hypothetical protein